jgi:hypothetical protein
MSERLRRGMALFVVVVLVGAVGSPVLASEGPEVREGWWMSVGTWLDRALETVGLQPIFEESACSIDPNGKPVPCPGPEIIQDESACSIDPNGRPRPCPNI